LKTSFRSDKNEIRKSQGSQILKNETLLNDKLRRKRENFECFHLSDSLGILIFKEKFLEVMNDLTQRNIFVEKNYYKTRKSKGLN